MNSTKALNILWFLFVFRPEWLITYYIPALGIIRIIPRLSLYIFVLWFFFSKLKKRQDTPFLLFMLSVGVSTLFAENTGLARNVLEQYIDYYLFFALSLSIINTMEEFDRFFKIFLSAFGFYLAFGLVYNGLVPYHPLLGDEDAYGPYMVMGVVLFYFLSFAREKPSKKMLFGTLMFTIGVVASFARGAIIGLAVGIFYIWVKSKRKMAVLFGVVVLMGVIILAGLIFFEGSKYIDEIASISGASEEQQEDRPFYWSKAVEIYKDNFVIGVGPRNYGVVLQDYVSEEESHERGRFTGFWYGRVPHSVYFQLLAEQGTLGVLTFLYLLRVFARRTKEIQRANIKCETDAQRKLYNYSLGFRAMMLVFLVTGAFYDFLYSEWFYEIILISAIVYRLQTKEEDSRSPVVYQ